MYSPKWKRLGVVLLLIWLTVTYFAIAPLKCPSNTEELSQYQQNLDTLQNELQSLKLQHRKLISLLKKSSSTIKDIDGSLLTDSGLGPPLEYEQLRWRVHTNTKELWYYINNMIQSILQRTDTTAIENLQKLVRETQERKGSLLSDIERLSEVDGYMEWRLEEAANVSNLIQRRLHKLQNPPNCKEARKLICSINKPCGFGCQVHHVVYCLIWAYATERTLVLKAHNWRYNPKGWDRVFLPISKTCTTFDEQKIHETVKNETAAKEVLLPPIDMIRRPEFLPLTVPEDLAERIARFNGDPVSWWIGQMVKYILKPQPHIQHTINETIKTLGFKKPIVGVHIRRTDKVGTEAAFHPVDEYMRHVEDYYNQRQIPYEQRRVYIASDDPGVLLEARSKYPSYTFLGDKTIAQAAAYQRYSPASLTGLLIDLQLLAMTDYLVCTFSSQVGRLAFEMMQANRLDASGSFSSLDDIYYFGGQRAHYRIVVLPHNSDSGKLLSLKVGDMIQVEGNHYDGYGIGVLRGTNKRTLFPWYKTNDYVETHKFP